MSSLALDLFVGPAVVVDDEVDQSETSAYAVAKELDDANFPVLRRREIPADQEIVHWQAMSLIVLDWDLLGTLSMDGSDKDTDDGSTILGVTLPDRMREGPTTDSLRFVRKLMAELYCPIFIISNHDVDGIWNQLENGLNQEESRQLRARVLVRSKTQAQGSLLEELSEWIAQHPAIYALKTWERGYETAKISLFADFQNSSVAWPGILWRTSGKDGVDPNHDLTETISRNLLHRMDRHLFCEELVLSATDQESLGSLRRVLFQQAVLPAERLDPETTMPGDFFFEIDEQDYPPSEIEICLTPACDLVARGQDSDSVRLFIVRASLVPDKKLKSKRAIKSLLGKSESTTSVQLHHLVPEDAMYIVRFKDWNIKTWGEVKGRRRGRLMEPYVTLLQQRNSLFSQRQGLPRLPDGFYMPRSDSE